MTNSPAQHTNPERLLEIIRREWDFENGLYDRRDVTFLEDNISMTNKSMGMVVTIINILVVSLLNRLGLTTITTLAVSSMLARKRL